MTYQLDISGIPVDVVRKNIKNMHLAVYPPTGRVRLAVPQKTDDEVVRLFALSKLGWIKRHQRSYNHQERIGPREYVNRESHYFQGKRYLLRMHETTGAGYVELSSKTYLDLYVRSASTLKHKEQILKEWYRTSLKQALPELINRWESKLKVKAVHYGIRQMKTKWGSCNTDNKRVLLNLELAKKPVSCLEYILVHEMIHLIERHHNQRFLELMNYHVPHWQALKAELNRLPASHADWGY